MSAIVGLALSTLLLGAAPVPSPRFVPGEALIKFAPGTEGSAAVARASQVYPPDLGALAPVVTRVAGKTGIPMKAKQVTGGNWVLLSVDGEKLTARLARRLRTRDNVARVRVNPDRPKAPVGVSLPKPLVITYVPGSPESEAAAQGRADPGDVRFARLVRGLERDLGLPLTGEVTGEAGVLLHIDLKALTPILVERLKALVDVDSAQLNYIVSIR
ncbi:MAG: hypothetical protein ACE5IQ_01680 [Candidatus Methylomirabilales bacterium]